jgi:cytochrome c oxidase cbb3-type subunit 2
MSDHLAAAAASLGVPEELVHRSAEARSTAGGGTVDDILAAWAGGGSAPAAATPTAEPAPATGPPVVEPVETTPAVPAQDAPAPAAAQPVPAAVITMRDPEAAPVLVGRRESPKALLLGLAGLLAFGMLVGAWLPALAAQQQADNNASSALVYSAGAEAGRGIYLAEGCATCHTMSVRSLVADAGLGLVTEPEDIPDFFASVEGVRRIGPDLAHIGQRMSSDELGDFLLNPSFARPGARHPAYSYLAAEQLSDLAAFMSETK